MSNPSVRCVYNNYICSEKNELCNYYAMVVRFLDSTVM